MHFIFIMDLFCACGVGPYHDCIFKQSVRHEFLHLLTVSFSSCTCQNFIFIPNCCDIKNQMNLCSVVFDSSSTMLGDFI